MNTARLRLRIWHAIRPTIGRRVHLGAGSMRGLTGRRRARKIRSQGSGQGKRSLTRILSALEAENRTLRSTISELALQTQSLRDALEENAPVRATRTPPN